MENMLEVFSTYTYGLTFSDDFHCLTWDLHLNVASDAVIQDTLSSG